MSYLLGNKGAHIYNGNKYTCDICGKVYKTRRGLQQHTCNTCMNCRRTFSSRQRLNGHKCYSNIQKQSKMRTPIDVEVTVTSPKKKTSSDAEMTVRAKRKSSCDAEVTLTAKKKTATSTEVTVTSPKKETSSDAEMIVRAKRKTSCDAEVTLTAKKKTATYAEVTVSSTNSKTLSDVEVTKTSAVETSLRFCPVSSGWQDKNTSKCNIPLQKYNNMIAYPVLEAPDSLYTVRGDGNCLFRAVSYVISGTEDFHIQLRSLTVKHLRNNHVELQSILPDGTTADDYLRRSKMSCNGISGSEVELFAISNLLQTDIYIYTLCGKTWTWLRFPATTLDSTTYTSEAIYLQHTCLNHYDVVRTVSSTSNMSSLSKYLLKQKEQEQKKEIEVFSHLGYKTKDEKLQCSLCRKEYKTHKGLENHRCNTCQDCQSTFSSHQKLTTHHCKKSNRQQYLREYKQNQRKDPKFREKEIQTRNKKWKNRDMKNEEMSKDRNQHRQRRSDPRVREAERLKDKNWHRDQRLHQDFRENERAKEKDWHKHHRMNPVFRENERSNDKDWHKDKRLDPSFRENERLKEKDWHRNQRRDPACRENERLKEKNWHRDQRLDPVYRENERHKERDLHRKLRLNPDIRGLQRSKEKEQRRKRRLDPDVREKERTTDRFQHKKRRLDTVTRGNERDRERKWKNKKRKQRKVQPKLQTLVVCFREQLKRGDEFVCTCCGQTFYQHSVYLVRRDSYRKKKQISDSILEKCLNGLKSVSNAEWICKTCHKYLSENQIPPMSLANGFALPEIPSEVKVWKPTDTEERCCSLRIPFMQIKQLGVGKQFGVYGNTVNVPMNPSQVVQVLPRRFEESETIQLQFMRKTSYKRPVIYETVRPKVIYNITKYLINNSQLYKDEGVKLAENWDEELEEDELIFGKMDDRINDTNNNTEDYISKNTVQNDVEDEWCELNTEEIFGTGNKDTMLQPLDYTDDGKHALKIAPGEGNSPISLYLDQFAEEKAFPVLFGGKTRIENSERTVNVSYGTICKAELRNQDRRFANSVPNIFFKLKKLQMLQVRDTIMTALRKTKGQQPFTAGELRKPENLQNLIRHDDGYKVLKNLRSSPPYLQSKQRDLFAMVRQLGLPTFFITLSAAETRWTDLLGVLVKKVYHKTMTEDEISAMSWMQKCELIQKDPVTCARHFQYRTHLFFHNILLSTASPLGKVTDFYYRVEFQQRGSPHIHCVLWVEGAPVYGSSVEVDVIAFIDKHCSSTTTSDEYIKDFVPLQHHKHSRSCKKNGRNICRFGFPIPPMRETLILEPLSSEVSATEMEDHKKNYKKVDKVLKDPLCSSWSFEDFLCKCSLSYDEYILAIRSSLKKIKIFLQRNPSDIRVNAYNHHILQIWQANIDIQYVLDPYAVCAYIASYIMKSQRGISLLLQQASEEVKKGNYSVKEKMKIVGNKFLNHCEVSAQEAIYLLLQMPLTQSSKDVIFVNTSPPEERVKILKPMSVLQTLPENCTDITCDGLHERYAVRPNSLENISFATFCSWYERRRRRVNKTKESVEEEEKCDKPVEDVEHKTGLFLPNGDELIKKSSPKIIRPVNFSKRENPEMFYREKIVLYTQWRDEENLKGEFETYEDFYKEKEDEIIQCMRLFDKLGDELVSAEEEVQEEEVLNALDVIAPSARQTEDDGLNESGDATEHNILQPYNDLCKEYDLGLDIGCAASATNQVVVPHRLSNEEFYSAARNMNSEQRRIMLHILNCVKTSTDPFYIFLSGGAGVGKTFLLKILYQTLLRYYDTLVGESPEETKVLLAAPTGKAAYNIKGSTLHSLFGIPANHSLSTYDHLDNSKLNTLRSKYAKLQILIIDEISMVGSNMLSFINKRLQQIFSVDKLFGGINLLLVGDLYQLRPVMDKWVFESSDGAYSSLAPNIWVDNVQIFELTQIMRQRDDSEFAATLNRLRENKCTQKDIESFESRLVDSNSEYPCSTPHLFTSNEKTDQHNSSVIAQMTTKGCTVAAVDFVIGNIPAEAKNKVLNLAHELPFQKTQNLRQKLDIKVNGFYMLTHNIDTSDGLTNGALCQIMEVQLPNPSVIWVKFEEDDIGLKCRQAKHHMYKKGIMKSWTPIFTVDKQFQVGRNFEMKVMRRQYPLTACSALTIHKSQGSSMKEAVISFAGKRGPGPHMIYVALSRVTRLEGLHLLDFNKKHIKVDEKVKEEMERLRREKSITCRRDSFPFANGFNVAAHNARSYHLHFEDVHRDSLVTQIDVLVILETWLISSDSSTEYRIEKFEHMYRSDVCTDSASTRPHGGILIYSKYPIQCVSDLKKGKTQVIAFTVQEVNILAVYKHQSTSFQILKNIMKESIRFFENDKKIVVTGDFNIDILASDKREIVHWITCEMNASCALREETTDYHTCLDHIYTSAQSYTTASFETYWSDHKIVIIQV